MLPALMAAKPLIKYGILIGVPLVILTISHTTVYFKGVGVGEDRINEKWNASIAAASAKNVHEVVKAEAMESKVVKRIDEDKRTIADQAKTVTKEVVRHAKKDPKPLSAATVAIYDRLISLPNEAGLSVPATDSGAGASPVPRAGVATEAPARISLDADGEPVELTTEELAQAAVDFAEKYALMKNAYKGLSEWNDGREQLELDRLKQE